MDAEISLVRHYLCLEKEGRGMGQPANRPAAMSRASFSCAVAGQLSYLLFAMPGQPTSNRIVFLDRDGVINRALEREAKPYPPRTLVEFEILPEVPAACAKLKAAGFLLVVATNQPDVGRGTLDQSIVEKIHAHMTAQLPIERVEVCYHPGKGASDCDCRKPKPGMLLRAARD